MLNTEISDPLEAIFEAKWVDREGYAKPIFHAYSAPCIEKLNCSI